MTNYVFSFALLQELRAFVTSVTHQLHRPIVITLVFIISSFVLAEGKKHHLLKFQILLRLCNKIYLYIKYSQGFVFLRAQCWCIQLYVAFTYRHMHVFHGC